MKANLTKRMVSLILAIVLLTSAMPTAAFATEEEDVTTSTTIENVETVSVDSEESTVPPTGENVVNTTAITAESDVVNVTNGKTFTMQGKYLDLLHNHSEYGVQDYLISEWQDEIRIYFMEGDTSSVTFKVWDSGNDSLANSFGVRASTNVWFMSYIYDKNTLTQIRSSRQMMPTTDMRIYSYSFAASFDIYKTSALDGNFKEFFYDASNTHPGVPDTTIPEDIVTVGNGKTFTMQGKYLKLLQSHNYYGTRDYLASVWQDEIIFYFLEDISNIKFSVWDCGSDSLANSFGIRPSQNVWAISYVYDANTLLQKRSSRQLISTADSHIYSYSFIASFDIYQDATYDRDWYFYDHTGTLPGVEITNPPEDSWNITNEKVFNMKGNSLWLLQNHNEYTTKNYLVYEWNDDIRIWFFDDISNVKFTTYEKFEENFANYFGILPSADVTFTEYVYNKNTLRLKRSEERTLLTSNGFTFRYLFKASFDIYWDETYNEKFYDCSREWSDNTDKGEPLNKVETKTGANTFSMKGDLTRIIVNHSEYGNKEFLSYARGGEFFILFFEDISNVKFSETNNQQFSYFMIKASQKVKFIEYIYDRETYKIKNVKTGTNADLEDLRCPFTFIASFDIYANQSDTSFFYRVNGDRPTLPSLEVNTIEVDMRKFNTIDEVYCNVIKECPEYKQGQRYLSYLWGADFVIWFFDDPDIKFSAFSDNYAAYFRVNPSVEAKYKAYVYSRNSLTLKSESYNLLQKNNGYTLTYNFVANLDIYKDETYKEYFYQGDEKVRNASSLFNVTNATTFSMPRSVYEQVKKLQKEDETLSNKNFLAYAWEDRNIIWFFDTPNMTAYAQRRIANAFTLVFSKNVQVTAFLYDRITGEFIEQSTFTVEPTNGYSYGHYFIADFNIYMNDKYNRYFYNAANNTIGKSVTFKPLTQEEAEGFLKFLTNNADEAEITEEKVELFKDFLMGKFSDDPIRELRLKLAFLYFAGTCMNIQLSNGGEQIDESETALINWLDDQSIKMAERTEQGEVVGVENKTPTEIFWNFVETFVGDAQEALVATITEGRAFSILELGSPKSMEEFLRNTLAAIQAVKGIDAVRTIDNIQYLKAYKRLLDAIDRDEEYDIRLNELNCSNARLNMSVGGDISRMERYARYFFTIEKSLPIDCPLEFMIS